ncbi:MAG TPA: hypothetical protein VM938_02220 [Acidimicrobiales bacterium]|nr:hypothetical protein [Acidimicrobiales bacterium]
MSLLEDGTYDVVVIDANEDDDGVVHVEVTVVSGVEKGNVVRLSGPRGRRDATDLLGLPATLDVVDGAPRLRL